MQSAYIPVIREEAKEYWKALNELELKIQRCSKCSRFIFYPREYCPYDMGELEFVKVSGKGKVVSFTIVEKYPDPVFFPHLPIIVAIIQLNEGPMMMSRLVDAAPEEVKFNQEVEVVFEKISDSITLPFFRPIR